MRFCLISFTDLNISFHFHRLSRDQEEQSSDVERLKKQLTILSQKKIRIESKSTDAVKAQFAQFDFV